MDLSTREGRREQGERIKESARLSGLTLDELARQIGCSRALIFQYASGASLAQSDRLQQIGQVVGKPLYWFFMDETQESAIADQDNRELDALRQQLDLELSQISREKARISDRRLSDNIGHLEAVLAASSSPADPRRIVDCCQQLQTLLTQSGDMDRLAAVLFQQGNALVQLQEWGAARERLQQSAEMYRTNGKAVQERDCLQSLGHANLMLGRVDEALQQFEYIASGKDWTNRWQGTLSIGAAHEVRGEYSRAISAFEAALNIVTERGDGQETETARLFVEANWANLELDFGDYSEARKRARICAGAAQRNGIQDQYIEALLTECMACFYIGTLHEGLQLVQSALDLSQLTGDRQRRAIALACSSLFQSAFGQTEAAISSAKEALSIALRTNIVRAEVMAQRALCQAYISARRDSEAAYHADEGLALARSQKLLLSQGTFAALAARARLLAGDIEAAGNFAAMALKTGTDLQVRPLKLEASVLLVETDRSLGRTKSARKHAEDALSIAAHMHPDKDIWRAFAADGLTRSVGQDGDKALLSMDRALRELDRLRDTMGEAYGELLTGDPLAEDLWRNYLMLTAVIKGRETAMLRAEGFDWPPVLEWFVTWTNESAEGSGEQ